MDRCSDCDISNPTPRFHNRTNPVLVLSLWCSVLDGECRRGGRSGSGGRQGHTGQEENRRQSQRWSGTSCSLLNVAGRSPPCPRQFTVSAQLLPRPSVITSEYQIIYFLGSPKEADFFLLTDFFIRDSYNDRVLIFHGSNLFPMLVILECG